MKPYKTEFIDNDGRRVTGAFLPIENGNVGGLEPWMVKYIRDPHPDYLPEGMKKTQLAASHAIAAAIAAILKEAEDETN